MATTKTRPVTNQVSASSPRQSKPWLFKPGQSGNPSGHPKAVLEVVAAARAHTEAAINTLATLTTEAKSPQARIMAATALLDRGWGKPVQPVLDETPKQDLFEGWTAEELRGALALLRRPRTPEEQELFLAQLRIEARQEAKA